MPLYTDNHILAVEKPAGIATQPDFHEEVRSFVKRAYNKPGNVFLEPIHRLDKPVSGIVLFARTSKALSRLNESVRQRALRKIYLARVEGIPASDGVLEHYLRHGDHRAHIVDENHPDGKWARLSYRVSSHQTGKSVVEIELETGRYHQIRAQFAAIGHPICGDHKYGGTSAEEGIDLHHHQLTIPHPTKGEEVIITSRGALFFEQESGKKSDR